MATELTQPLVSAPPKGSSLQPLEVQLPPISVAMGSSFNRWWRLWWSVIGILGFGLILVGLLSIPGAVEFAWIIVFVLLPVCLIPAQYIIIYYSRVSHLMPSKPVGRYAKHGFELIVLTYALLEVMFEQNPARRLAGIFLVTGFNMFVHTMYQLRRNPPDLVWRDLFLTEVMVVAVYVCGFGESMYAVVSTYVACLMVIGYRFCFYSCPETSDVPISIPEMFGIEKA